MVASVNLLHITDLHFTADGIPEYVGKDAQPEIRERVGMDRSDQFIAHLKSVLAPIERVRWPQLILVTGDVVDYGGRDRPEEAFAKAADFLGRLAKVIGKRDEHVFVVPGNHDVDWSPGLTQPARFRRFTNAMSRFTIPGFDGSNPVARLESIPNITQDVSIEILLLVSPTFSGMTPQTPTAVIDAVQKFFPDASDEDRNRLRDALRGARGPLDIAAIGPKQRAKIQEIPREGDPVRIALLHHHLLPHPEIEAGPFESVLDAGPVIEEMLPRFALVLTGHKHTQRLLQLRKGEECLDIYSGPSLFRGHEGSRSGFTMIEVHGCTGPYYATLKHWFTMAGAPTKEDDRLIRRGRVHPRIPDICAQVSPDLQERRIIPALEHLTRGLQWSQSHEARELFDHRWKELEKELSSLSDQTLVFRPPNLSSRWRQLLTVAQKGNVRLRLVSNNDVKFWKESLRPDSDADFYERAVRDFRGDKSRILILDRQALREGRTSAVDITQITDAMRKYDVETMVVWSEEVPPDTCKDFGIIGDLAVSEFDGNGVTGRSLLETFSKSKRDHAEELWETLSESVRWRSGTKTRPGTPMPFDEWFTSLEGGSSGAD